MIFRTRRRHEFLFNENRAGEKVSSSHNGTCWCERMPRCNQCSPTSCGGHMCSANTQDEMNIWGKIIWSFVYFLAWEICFHDNNSEGWNQWVSWIVLRGIVAMTFASVFPPLLFFTLSLTDILAFTHKLCVYSSVLLKIIYTNCKTSYFLLSHWLWYLQILWY